MRYARTYLVQNYKMKFHGHVLNAVGYTHDAILESGFEMQL